ncbi:MAG: threonine/serine exporter family protein [Suipraeoptans sp.]
MGKELLIEIPVAIIGTTGFTILFGVSKRHYLTCGLNGAFSWLIYRIALNFALSPPVATFIAAFALTTMSRILSVRSKAPTTIFLYGGILTLVPGTGIYAIAYKLFLGYALEGFMTATDTLKTAIAIGLGIGVAYMIPPHIFGWGKYSQIPEDASVSERNIL